MQLVVQSGAEPGRTYDITASQKIRMGRQSGNDVIVPDEQVSRRHAEIEERSGNLVVTDLGSSNGTFVNGTRIASPQTLKPGDTVQVGTTVLKVLGAASSATAANDYDGGATQINYNPGGQDNAYGGYGSSASPSSPAQPEYGQGGYGQSGSSYGGSSGQSYDQGQGGYGGSGAGAYGGQSATPSYDQGGGYGGQSSAGSSYEQGGGYGQSSAGGYGQSSGGYGGSAPTDYGQNQGGYGQSSAAGGYGQAGAGGYDQGQGGYGQAGAGGYGQSSGGYDQGGYGGQSPAAPSYDQGGYGQQQAGQGGYDQNAYAGGQYGQQQPTAYQGYNPQAGVAAAPAAAKKGGLPLPLIIGAAVVVLLIIAALVFFLVINKGGGGTTVGSDIPAPPNSTKLDISAQDIAKLDPSANTADINKISYGFYTSSDAPNSLLNFYRTELKNRGWTEDTTKATSSTNNSGAGFVKGDNSAGVAVVQVKTQAEVDAFSTAIPAVKDKIKPGQTLVILASGPTSVFNANTTPTTTK